MKPPVPFSLILLLLLSLKTITGMPQSETRKIILDDGTAVKIYPDGRIELKFPPDKVVQEATITKTGEVTTRYQEKTTEAANQPEGEGASAGKALPGSDFFSLDPAQLDEGSRKSFIRARTHYFEYFSEGYAHRQRVFRWQLVSSKIIFVVVILLVFSGIVFAAIQFYAGLKKVTGEKEQVTVTTFEAGSSGLKISSPVLGLIILVISLVFFYLYLVYIYPIAEIF